MDSCPRCGFRYQIVMRNGIPVLACVCPPPPTFTSNGTAPLSRRLHPIQEQMMPCSMCDNGRKLPPTYHDNMSSHDGCRLLSCACGAIISRRAIMRAVGTSDNASKIASDLERLCCAETEGKFFDYVTENIQEIIAELRGKP